MTNRKTLEKLGHQLVRGSDRTLYQCSQCYWVFRIGQPSGLAMPEGEHLTAGEIERRSSVPCPGLSETKKVEEHLRANPGSRFCDECLAGRVGIGQWNLMEALKAVKYLDRVHRGQGECSFCGKRRDITGFLLMPVC